LQVKSKGVICTTILIIFSSNKYFNIIFEIFYEAHKLSFNTSTSLLGLWALVGKKNLLLQRAGIFASDL